MEIQFARKVDELGRIVLPLDIRRLLGVEARDVLLIDVEDGRIVLTPQAK